MLYFIQIIILLFVTCYSFIILFCWVRQTRQIHIIRKVVQLYGGCERVVFDTMDIRFPIRCEVVIE